jgi:hypothetical protein
MRQEIKKLLEMGSTIKAPYKTKINEWFAEVSITKLWDEYDQKTTYFISPFAHNFTDIDEAVDKFISYAYSPKNYGYIQIRLTNRGNPPFDEYDIENPSKKLKKIFEDESKIVEEEYSQLLN